ncbi:MAG: isopeptide-forming domain-containing fimbrial protein [Oscillospiraceae bacterium]|nr:isopeptide-forming domain-containing fimbrial protein [Oscillospiraceae bacterium]
MNRLKKYASLLLALVMALALAVPAMAGENETPEAPEIPETPVRITAPSNKRTYEVFQIFTGKLEDGILSNVKWGQNGTGTVGQGVDAATLEALEAVTTGKGDSEKLAVIEQYVNLESEAIGEISGGSSLDVAPGYYLIKDMGEVAEGESYSLYVVQLVGDVTITPKTSDTTLEKGVKDVNDSEADSESDYQESADYDIGDDVPYQLKATLGERISDYETYKLVFTDTMDKGLTYNNDAKVYIKNESDAKPREVTNSFIITSAENGDGTTTLTVSIDDAKAAPVSAGNKAVITVEYTAKLNEDAVVGGAGNVNKATLEYSNDPNWDGNGNPPTGTTPEEVAVVFTLKTIVNKVEKNPNYDPNVEGSEEFIPLKGAGFTLYKKDASGEYIQVGEEVKGEEMTQFVFSGLDDGDYMLKETTTPVGYNTIEDIYFTITAEHTVEGLTTLEGTNAENGNVFTGELTAGSLTTNVENNKGATLPETGGIGTTIFYALGGLLTVGAVVLLVTKKRMSADEK